MSLVTFVIMLLVTSVRKLLEGWNLACPIVKIMVEGLKTMVLVLCRYLNCLRPKTHFTLKQDHLIEFSRLVWRGSHAVKESYHNDKGFTIFLVSIFMLLLYFVFISSETFCSYSMPNKLFTLTELIPST